MARRRGGLLRSALEFLQDVPPGSSRLGEAHQELQRLVSGAQEDCERVTASAARLLLDLQCSEQEQARLLDQGAEQLRRGDDPAARETARRVLAERQRCSALREEHSRWDQAARALRSSLEDLRAGARQAASQARGRDAASASRLLQESAARLAHQWSVVSVRTTTALEAGPPASDVPETALEATEFHRRVRDEVDREALEGVIAEMRARTASAGPDADPLTPGAPAPPTGNASPEGRA